MRKELICILLEPAARLPQIDQLSHRSLYWLHIISEFSSQSAHEPKPQQRSNVKQESECC